jgi:acyl carrier protein
VREDSVHDDGIERDIEEFIVREFLFGEASVGRDEDLFAAGIVDSFGFMRLLQFFGDKFGVQVEMKDIEMATFDTVNKAAAWIRLERARRGPRSAG